MNKRIFPLIIAALMTVGFASCEKVIEFNGDITDPYIVVLSQPEADSTWMLRVSQSRFFLSSAAIPEINNAQVHFTVNGIAAGNLASYEGDGVYNTSIIPQPGDSLELHVTVPNRGEVTAACRIPQRPTASDFRIEYDTTIYEYNWTDYYDSTHIERNISGNINLHFKINDPANERNYYMLRLATYVGEWSYRNIDVDDDILFDIDATNEVFGFDDDDPSSGNYVLFTDERINGNVHPTTVSVYFGSICERTYSSDPNEEFTLYPARLEIYSISRDIYLYLKTLSAAGDQDEFTQILSEPVQVHTNINGGIGVLGASAKTVINF